MACQAYRRAELGLDVSLHRSLQMGCGLRDNLFFPSQSAIESLFGASMTGIAYSLFAGQALTILGSTGPVLVFEKILFKFCK